MGYEEMIGKNLKRLRVGKGLTQDEFANLLSTDKATVSKWEHGKIRVDMAKVLKFINDFSIDIQELMDIEVGNKMFYRVPFLGKVQCGKPIFAKENIDDYKMLPISYKYKGDYFYLKAQGDSMIEANIHAGDFLLIKKQSSLDEGDIGVFLFNEEEEVTLKKYHFEQESGKLVLKSKNIYYDDIIVEDISQVQILGKLEKVERRALDLNELLEKMDEN